MNATIHHANGMIVKRSIKDFGHKMITEAKNEVVGHLSAKDLDDVADLILEKASDNFLDKALERRLGTIDARSLINALARAERLGYENNDAMDQNPDSTPMPEPFPSSTPQAPVRYQQQRHQPQTAQPAQPAQPVHRPHTVQPEPQLASRPAPTRNLQCSLCWRRFATVAPFEYVSMVLADEPLLINSIIAREEASVYEAASNRSWFRLLMRALWCRLHHQCRPAICRHPSSRLQDCTNTSKAPCK